MVGILRKATKNRGDHFGLRVAGQAHLWTHLQLPPLTLYLPVLKVGADKSGARGDELK
jgi:hypothetical protein